jgi:CAAX protease family protein
VRIHRLSVEPRGLFADGPSLRHTTIVTTQCQMTTMSRLMTAVKAGIRARFGLALTLMVALVAVGNAATNVLIPPLFYVPTALLLALLAVLVAVRVGGCTTRDLGLDQEHLGQGLRLGAAAAAVLAVVLVVGAALPATRDLFADRRVDQHSMTLLLYHTLVRIPLGTVVLEETLFRGALLGLALRSWSPPVAVAFSSVLFGLWHLLPARGVSSFNPVVATATQGTLRHVLLILLAVAATALAGAVFCWLRLRARSLAAPAMLHLAGNSLAYLLAWTVLRST